MVMLARSESRDGYAVRVLAVHTTEGSGTAESLRDAAWWTGSSHALADDSGKLLTPADGCVPYNLAAWTLRSGNRWSENIELVGFAKWKRGDWLARPKLLDACARWLAARSVARGIPLVKLTPKEYAAGRSGVIGHVDHTIGYSDGTHWDPGPDFPYDVVLARAQALVDGKDKNPAPTVSEEDEPMLLNVAPGASAVIPLPPGSKTVLLAVDEAEGGANVRVAVGWGDGKFHPLNADMAKVDGFTGWLPNGRAADFPLKDIDQTLTVTHRAGRSPVGVLILR